MAARIPYSVATPWGAQVQKLASLTAQAQALSARMVTAMNSMSSGGAGPFGAMETELGLAAGSGTLLYTLITNAKANLAIVAIAEIDNGT